MAVLRSFRALRPRADKASTVASVPYDVVDTVEARELAAGNPDSFLHVVRPEIDLPPETDIHDDEVYAQAPRSLARLIDSGSLFRDEESALYLYRQIMDGHAQIGVVGCGAVDDYDQDLLKKHEKTRPDKEDDRTRHVLTLSAQLATGQPLPSWVQFEPASRRFSGRVPPSASGHLEIEVIATDFEGLSASGTFFLYHASMDRDRSG